VPWSARRDGVERTGLRSDIEDAVCGRRGLVRDVHEVRRQAGAAVTATSGGVLFTGDLDNNFLVLDAASGKTLYRFNTGGSVGGGVLTYELNGKQYVATTSGVVSGFFGGSGTSAVIILSL
jgi:outer membrane protein assembly factor BamB